MVSGLGNGSAQASTTNGLISFGGLASGLNTNAIIDALMQAEQRPVLVAQNKLAEQQLRQATLQGLSGSIASFASAVAVLKDPTVVGGKLASTNQLYSDVQKLTATASSSASVGAFNVDILGLATSTKVQAAGALGNGVSQNVALKDSGFTVPILVGTFSIDGTAFTIDDNTKLSNGTDLAGANTILAKINNAGIGVTANVVNDASGRPNLLQLASGAAIQLGSGADTSNFLAAANLLQSPGTTTRTSTRPLAGVNQTALLQDARLATPLGAASGEFKINGVSVTWDATADSLSNVISRINASGAGVTATFDISSDHMIVTANATGSSVITLQDVASNFLAATGVLGTTQTLGANASYKIDGGVTQYSSTNTVADAVTGVSLAFSATTSSAITVTVAADNNALRSRLQTFVQQYNSTLAALTDATKYGGGAGKRNGALFGDPMAQRMQQTLRSLITQSATGITGDLNSLSTLGLNFGAVGAAVGTTNTLNFDATKFNTVIAANPDGVARLLSAFSATAALDGGGTGSIASISGKPTAAPDSGKYMITSTAAGVLTVTYQADNGGPLIVSTGNLTAGGVNTTIIPGVAITAKPVLVDGVDTITIGAAEEGIAKTFTEYLNSLTSVDGMLQAGTDSTQSTIDDINKQITTLNARADAKRQELQQKFTSLELTMQQLQGQQSALAQLQNTLNPTPKR